MLRLADVITDAVTIPLREDELNLADFQALAVLDGAEAPMTAIELNAYLHLTSGSVTSLLDRLEKRSLVARQPHPTDRRKVHVAITDGGRALVDAHLPGTVAIQTALFAALTTEQLTELNGLVTTLLLASRDLDPLTVAETAPERGPH